MATKAPKGSKAGTKVTFADGSTGYVTEGGQYRIDSGPNKGKLWEGDVPGGAAGASSGPSLTGPQTTTNTTPPNFSPEGSAYLNKSKTDLQGQVAQGLISQLQADQEYARQEQRVASMSPALQQSAWSLANQPIPQAGQENEIYRLQSLENQTSPNTTGTIDANSSSAEVTNQIRNDAKANTMSETLLTNANQVNPFGSQNVTIDPITGQPTVKQELSQPNQQALSGIQGTGVQASQVAQGLLGNQYGSFVQGAGPQSGYSDPALEQAVYARLTRDFGDRFGREEEALTQQLANRGIPVGSQAYTNAMNDFRRNRDAQYESAANQATIQGSQTALQRQQNNIGALGTLNQGVGTLSGVGQSGFYLPNFQGFNAGTYQQPNVQDIWNVLYGGQLSREQMDAQIEQQKIAAGATLGAAGKAAEASKYATDARSAESSNSSAFNTRPPGS